MIYIELYLYDYLKKKAGRGKELELWGEYRKNDFYICYLRPEGERKPFYKAHMQYLGNYRGIAGTERKKIMLTYLRGEEICRREAAVYVAKETEQIEQFLIRDGWKEQIMLKNAEKALEKTVEAKNRENPEGTFLKILVCGMLIFLAANMIDVLSTYKNMREVIEVVELLVK